MQNSNEERPQLQYRGRHFGGRGLRLFTKILAVGGGALVLAGAVMISVVVFAVAAAVVVVFGLYLWWKTRDLRKQMRAQMQAQTRPRQDNRGNVIEGEFVRKDEPPGESR